LNYDSLNRPNNNNNNLKSFHTDNKVDYDSVGKTFDCVEEHKYTDNFTDLNWSRDIEEKLDFGKS